MVYDKLESLNLAECHGCRDVKIMETKKIAVVATTIYASTNHNNHIHINIIKW